MAGSYFETKIGSEPLRTAVGQFAIACDAHVNANCIPVIIVYAASMPSNDGYSSSSTGQIDDSWLILHGYMTINTHYNFWCLIFDVHKFFACLIFMVCHTHNI